VAQKELETLFILGILRKQVTKARVYYQIDTSSPRSRPLKEEYNTTIELARDKGVLRGKHIEPAARQYVANWLARQFVVSSEVIERCMQRDKL
jgi:hypothetical protein